MESTFKPAEYIQFISFNGKQILFVDYSNCKDKYEMMELMKASVPYYNQSPAKLLTLSDFNNIKGSSEFMDLAKRLAREVFDAKTEKGALLGIQGIKKVLVQGYNLVAKQKMKPFDTKEEALRYLAE